jgi:hypothetical protein
VPLATGKVRPERTHGALLFPTELARSAFVAQTIARAAHPRIGMSSAQAGRKIIRKIPTDVSRVGTASLSSREPTPHRK